MVCTHFVSFVFTVIIYLYLVSIIFRACWPEMHFNLIFERARSIKFARFLRDLSCQTNRRALHSVTKLFLIILHRERAVKSQRFQNHLPRIPSLIDSMSTREIKFQHAIDMLHSHSFTPNFPFYTVPSGEWWCFVSDWTPRGSWCHHGHLSRHFMVTCPRCGIMEYGH